MRFTGTKDYVATDDLKVAVNAAVALRAAAAGQGRARHRQDHARRGDRQGARRAADRPGTSSRPPRRSRASTNTTRCARLRDSQLGDERVHDIAQLHQAAASSGRRSARRQRPVLLIDEIDKADIEFPNDLLQELDRMEFYVYETNETMQGRGAADRRHHLEQREGAARRVPAPLLLPLHPLSRTPRR